MNLALNIVNFFWLVLISSFVLVEGRRDSAIKKEKRL